MTSVKRPLPGAQPPPAGSSPRVSLAQLPARAAHLLIRTYQLTLSGLIGRGCRHWPSCSDYTDEAIQRFGLWRGGWMGLARICRCQPWGTAGIDCVPAALPDESRWYKPWRYGRWRSALAEPPGRVDTERTASTS